MTHTTEQDLLYKLALTRLPKVGPVTAKNLISYCGSAASVFTTQKKSLLKIPGIGPQMAQTIQNHSVHLKEAESIFRQCEKEGVKILFYLDEQFPQRLRHIPDSPLILYYKGQNVLNNGRMVAIVGTRNPTEYGKIQTTQIIDALQKHGIVVVSGLAYGIDITAHQHAVKTGVPTLGVLGSGLGKIYPQLHHRIAKEMLGEGGIITEFDFDKGPDRENFPMRNRLIAGMSDAIIVIESAARGGSMITAEIANGYNKDVFALPGRPSDEMSAGCNQLIKLNKAHLIEKGEDIADILRWEQLETPAHVQRQIFVELNDDENLIVEKIRAAGQIEIDLLANVTQFQMSKLATVLLSLELKGVIKSLPGKKYVLL